MKVLLSAYACEPGAGSELGKGWNFALELARQVDEVVVLTCGSHHRKVIEEFAATKPLPKNLSFLWHDVPGWMGPGYSSARHIRKHYLAWQLTAPRAVTRIFGPKHFDVVHHLTWTVLRWPSFLGRCGQRFVFGPVGGGQSTPFRLRAGFARRGIRAELIRDLMNVWSRIDPLLWLSLRSCHAIIVTDEATRQHVQNKFLYKTFIIADIYSKKNQNIIIASNDSSKRRSILFVGRLEYWKGLHLAIGALSKLKEQLGYEACLTIAGSGPEEVFFKRLTSKLGLNESVKFLGSVPFAEIESLYLESDVLLFPSLHDSGPHTIGEALAHALPVVCLDLGGPGIAIDESCGSVVSTAGQSTESVEFALAEAVKRILTDPLKLSRLKYGALERAASFSYESRVRDIVQRFYVS